MSFKKLYENKVVVLLALALGLVVIINVALYGFMRLKVKGGDWIEFKGVKSLLMDQLSPEAQIIFVGSSRTLYGIDTDLMGKSGIQSFNYGLSGLQWQDYGYIINRLKNTKAKVIALVLNPDRLRIPLVCPKEPTFSDFVAFYRVYGPSGLRKKNCHLLRRSIQELLPLNRYKKYLSSHLHNKKKCAKNLSILRAHYGTPLTLSEVNRCFGHSEKHLVMNLRSGNGVIFAQYPQANPKQQLLVVRKIDPEAKRYLKILVDKIKAIHKLPLVIFEPRFVGRRYVMPKKALSELLPGTVIFYTNDDHFPVNYWAFHGEHLNALGREAYTKELLALLVNHPIIYHVLKG